METQWELPFLWTGVVERRINLQGQHLTWQSDQLRIGEHGDDDVVLGHRQKEIAVEDPMAGTVVERISQACQSLI